MKKQKKNIEKSKRERYAALDGIRGIILISMLLYHATWDLVNIFDVSWTWFRSEMAYIWQQSICWGFILLSGFCWHFGRVKWKRGLMVFTGGVVVTLVTKLFMPNSIIIFGVLTLLGSCMLIMIVLDRWLHNWNPILGMVLFFGLFFITRNVNYRYLGFEGWNILRIPDGWYANEFTTYLGFMESGFFSTDYFSLIPWLFLFVTGYFLNRLLETSKVYVWLKTSKCRWLEWMGRHSLLIYMLHQPVIYGVLCFIYMLLPA